MLSSREPCERNFPHLSFLWKISRVCDRHEREKQFSFNINFPSRVQLGEKSHSLRCRNRLSLPLVAGERKAARSFDLARLSSKVISRETLREWTKWRQLAQRTYELIKYFIVCSISKSFDVVENAENVSRCWNFVVIMKSRCVNSRDRLRKFLGELNSEEENMRRKVWISPNLKLEANKNSCWILFLFSFAGEKLFSEW